MKSDRKAFCKKYITVILCAFILILSIVLYLCVNINSSEGEFVAVNLDGSLYGTYSLYEDRQERIVSDSGYNLLVIKNGMAYISEADCAGQICVHTKAISTVGPQIVCLPHKLVISVEKMEEKTDTGHFSQDNDRERYIDAVTN